MNAKELAAKLSGATYSNVISKELAADAKAVGLVVVYGQSDDLMEFEGAIHDEFSCYDGGTALVDAKGLLPDRDGIDEDDELRDYFNRQPVAKTIEALWCKEAGLAWTFATTIPHETFIVTEDDEVYCRGIVFALSDLTA